jgi:t-SNARE complex subunit (syntaxin)
MTKALSQDSGFSESIEEYSTKALKWPAERNTRMMPVIVMMVVVVVVVLLLLVVVVVVVMMITNKV